MAGNEGSTGASLADRAYRELEELIVALALVPGTAHSEGQLAERLAIGRTPVRESLHRLAREGLVVILPRRGILISTSTSPPSFACWRCAARSNG